jgi:hypothetical protein
MPKYLVSWTEETWYNTYIEAESKEKAEEMFWDNEDDCISRAKPYGSDIQETIDVEEVKSDAEV